MNQQQLPPFSWTNELGGISKSAAIRKSSRIRVFIGGVWKTLPEAYPRVHNRASFEQRSSIRRHIPQWQPKPSPTFVLEPAPEGKFGLIDLSDNMCRWPIGDPKRKGFHFCARKKAFGVSYCEYHAAIARAA